MNPSAPAAPPAGTPFGGPRADYAGFWIRFLASLIDGLILSPLIFIFLLVVAGVGFGIGAAASRSSRAEEFAPFLVLGFLLFYVLFLVGVWLYHALCESSSLQATLGKKALNIQVTDLEGHRVTFGRASGRHFAKIISGMILNIGFIMAGFTEKKQALHDMIAGTLVVRR